MVCLWDVGSGLAHMRGVIWRAVPAKFKTGMCEMKILGSEILWCVFRTGWHTLVQLWFRVGKVHMQMVSSVCECCSGKVQNWDV